MMLEGTGSTWLHFMSPPVYPLGAGPADVRSLLINFKNPNILYVETVRVNGCAIDEKTVFKSTDGGATWSDSISPPSQRVHSRRLFSLHHVDGNGPYGSRYLISGRNRG